MTKKGPFFGPANAEKADAQKWTSPVVRRKSFYPGVVRVVGWPVRVAAESWCDFEGS